MVAVYNGYSLNACKLYNGNSLLQWLQLKKSELHSKIEVKYLCNYSYNKYVSNRLQ